MIFLRSLVVWLILIAVEILHGIARGIFLVPHVGQFRSNEIGVLAGSLIILGIALAFPCMMALLDGSCYPVRIAR